MVSTEEPGAHVPRDVNVNLPVFRKAGGTARNPRHTGSIGKYHEHCNVAVRSVQTGFLGQVNAVQDRAAFLQGKARQGDGAERYDRLSRQGIVRVILNRRAWRKSRVT